MKRDHSFRKLQNVNDQLKAIRHAKWPEWCAKLNEHNNIGILWKWFRRVAGKKSTKPPTHPNPHEEANRLAEAFASRDTSAQLPLKTRALKEELHESRWETITQGCSQADSTDSPFTIQELKQTKHHGKAWPGANKITYTMINNMGGGGERAFLHLVNTQYTQQSRIDEWNDQDTKPIPKPKDSTNPRPISLLCSLEKMMENMVLRCLKWKIGPLNPHLYAYTEGVGTIECITIILSTVNSKPGPGKSFRTS